MRDLTYFEDNQITLKDPVSGAAITFTHRTPTTADRVQYMSRRFRRDGNRLFICQKQAAIEAAAAIITGVSDNSFACGRDQHNNPLPLSSDPASPHYRADWKQLLQQMAGDLLYIIGNQLFEGPPDLDDLATLELINTDAQTPATEEE